MQRLLGSALRRVRLLTVVALVAVPWLILSLDLGWREAALGAAALLALAVIAAAAAWLTRRSGPDGT